MGQEKNDEFEFMKDREKDRERKDNLYKIEIEELKSELRKTNLENRLFESRLKSMGSEIILNYDGNQEIPEENEEVFTKHRKEPPSPSPPKHVAVVEKNQQQQQIRPNQFLNFR